MLYNLESGKQEKNKLADQQTDIVKLLSEKLADWEKDLMSPAWPGVMEYEQEIDGIKMRYAL